MSAPIATAPATHGPTPTTTPVPHGPTPTKSKWNIAGGIAIAVFFILIVIAIFRLLYPSDSNPNDGNESGNGGSSSPKTEENASYWYKDVYYSKNSTQPVYLPAGYEQGSFLDASQPYCVTNTLGHKECGAKGQDVFKKLGDGEENQELVFTSTNGQDGYLKIKMKSK